MPNASPGASNRCLRPPPPGCRSPTFERGVLGSRRGNCQEALAVRNDIPVIAFPGGGIGCERHRSSGEMRAWVSLNGVGRNGVGFARPPRGQTPEKRRSGKFHRPRGNRSCFSAASRQGITADLGTRGRAGLSPHHMRLATQERDYGACWSALSAPEGP